ncbi:hypothetical protein EJ110_NYTH46832, partial [Nymphaea thermarum]
GSSHGIRAISLEVPSALRCHSVLEEKLSRSARELFRLLSALLLFFSEQGVSEPILCLLHESHERSLLSRPASCARSPLPCYRPSCLSVCSSDLLYPLERPLPRAAASVLGEAHSSRSSALYPLERRSASSLIPLECPLLQAPCLVLLLERRPLGFFRSSDAISLSSPDYRSPERDGIPLLHLNRAEETASRRFVKDRSLIVMANSSSSSTQWNAISALVSVKLTRDNYLLCSSQLESVMESQELVQFIDGTLPPPPETIMKDGKNEVNPDFAIWKKSDRLALSWIKATVSESVLRQIPASSSSYTVLPPPMIGSSSSAMVSSSECISLPVHESAQPTSGEPIEDLTPTMTLTSSSLEAPSSDIVTDVAATQDALHPSHPMITRSDIGEEEKKETNAHGSTKSADWNKLMLAFSIEWVTVLFKREIDYEELLPIQENVAR